MKTLKNTFILLAFCTAFVLSCAEEEVGPVLQDSSTFIAPVLQNPASSGPYVFTPDIAPEVYEEFVWGRTRYNLSLATDYAIEMSDTEDFDNPRIVATTLADRAAITNRRFNDVMLSLGLPGFQESTVYLRVRSTISGMVSSDTLYSNIISRTATTFQSSECGNFCTIGLIGSATPGGWDNDTDMRLADPEKVDKSTWTVTLFLEGGQQVKFRANDAWDDNWGGSSFPEGTGAKGGDDITVAASGYYRIVFNDESGNYSFTLVNPKSFATIGVIGSATPGGWDNDTDLVKDGNDPHLWTGNITLTEGDVKFRAEDDWNDNWGGPTFPSGYGVGGGPDITVKAGNYFVWFNSATGEYAFINTSSTEPFATIGILGSATSGGWDSDIDLIQNPANPYKWSKIVTISEGDAKFRADDDWADNWGASDFPGGIATPGGPDIPASEGTYFVTFNSGTGEYYFLK